MTPILHQTTAHMPCKTIQINGRDYLRRYYVGETPDHYDLWLHEFLSCDGEKHLHNHPWTGCSVVLSGGYSEQLPSSSVIRLAGHEGAALIEALRCGTTLRCPPGAYQIEAITHWHRIESVLTGTWTAMFVRPHREKYWYFKEPDGSPVCMLASPRNWWQDYLTRDGNVPG